MTLLMQLFIVVGALLSVAWLVRDIVADRRRQDSLRNVGLYSREEKKR